MKLMMLWKYQSLLKFKLTEADILPRANYGHWMGFHPDGRIAVGYRAGAYVVRLAMKNSGKDIIELSKLSVEEIYRLANLQD